MHDTHHHMGVFEKKFVVGIFGCMDFWVVTSGVESLWMTSTDSDDELRLAPGNYILDSTKREILGSKLS